MAKKKKVRVDLRKNRSKPPRERQWTRGFQEHGFAEDATKSDERIRAKGDLSRRRTIIQDETAEAGAAGAMPSADATACLPGRVLRVHGLHSVVETEDGRQFRCVVRRMLRTLATDERGIVTTGDRVWFLPSRSEAEAGADGAEAATVEGVIERVEPRHGVLTRSSRGREHVQVANVDQVVFVLSLVEPDLKPHLIDRYLASAEQGGVRPILCLNKADLVDPVDYQALIGLYSQLGVPTFLTSASAGTGIERLRRRLRGRETVFTGQSGVGKSSLAQRHPAGTGAAGARGERRQPEGQAHDDDGGADPSGLRRLGGGHAGRAPVRAVGRDTGGSGGLFRGIPAVRGPVRLPRLHAHARGALRRQARRRCAAGSRSRAT